MWRLSSTRNSQFAVTVWQAFGANRKNSTNISFFFLKANISFVWWLLSSSNVSTANARFASIIWQSCFVRAAVCSCSVYRIRYTDGWLSFQFSVMGEPADVGVYISREFSSAPGPARGLPSSLGTRRGVSDWRLASSPCDIFLLNSTTLPWGKICDR
jgi:hypothetical protein